MKHKNLLNIKVFTSVAIRLLLCTALVNSAYAQDRSEKSGYLPSYRVVLELENLAGRLPDQARLLKVEITGKNIRIEGESGGADQTTILGRLLPKEGAEADISPYTIRSLPDASGFELNALVNKGIPLPGDTPTTITGRNEAYSLPILEHSLGRGISFEKFKHSLIGLPDSGLDRFDFGFTTSYQSMIDWLVRAPMMSRALIQNIRIVKTNVSQVTVSGTAYLGNLINDQQQSNLDRKQLFIVMRLSQRMSLGKKNPFAVNRLTLREPEPLEQFKLAELSVLAILGKGDEKVALVKTNSAGLLYQLKIGNHMGDQEGRIDSMTDKEIILLELVKDEQGKTSERRTVLSVLNK